MKSGRTILKTGGIIGGFITLILIISFAERKEAEYRMEDINIQIENTRENLFIDQADVMALIVGTEKDFTLGDPNGRINLKTVETRIETHSFVKNAEVYRDLKGHLLVKVKQHRPVARLIAENGKSAYVGEEGTLLPVSGKYTARVPVITGRYVRQLLHLKSLKTEASAFGVFNLINYINTHKFWTMQIAHLDIDLRGNVVMYPQLGDQRLEFGKAEDIDKKFKKLKIFFERIMPTKGWNTYDRVNVAFKDQIICE